jgi:hypothetical protein
VVIGTATFFDGIDFLAIAMALPAGAWHFTQVQVGLLISSRSRRSFFRYRRVW